MKRRIGWTFAFALALALAITSGLNYRNRAMAAEQRPPITGMSLQVKGVNGTFCLFVTADGTVYERPLYKPGSPQIVGNIWDGKAIKNFTVVNEGD